MSYNYSGSKPPPYSATPPPQWPPPYQPAQHTSAQPQVSYSYYVPGMVTVPTVPSSPNYHPGMATVQNGVPSTPHPNPNLTYVTNYIYQVPPVVEPVVVPPPKDFEWIPAVANTATHLTGKAVVGGYEADGNSPLWVIRAKHNGYLIPGKFSVKTSIATVTSIAREVQVQDIEVLCIRPDKLKWVPVNGGLIPPKAIEGGRGILRKPLYIGRAKYQQALIPGRVDSRTRSCYIGFGGTVKCVTIFEVLCKIE